MEDISFVWNVVSKPISSCDCIIGHFLSIKGVRELAGSGVAMREGRTPKVPAAHKRPKIWYNTSAFSEEDGGLKNRAGGPSEMMLI